MTTHNLTLARRYLSELWSRGELAMADEIIAVDATLHDPLCGRCTGRDAIKAAIAELRAPFPDLAFSLDTVVVEAGDQLALRWFARGTHRAPLFGIPPTGRTFVVSGLLLMRFAARQLTVITASWDPLLLLEQLGLLGCAFEPEPLPVPPPFAIAQAESELDAGWV